MVPAEASAIEEITVTARRREETVQQAPLAVSAFSRERLDQMQAQTLADIERSVPNLNLIQAHGSSSTASIFLRGIGQSDGLQTFDPGIGVYVDGVYLARVQGALLWLSDVERIEVLRGPQGTLYGRNSVGGAIKVISRRPDMERLTGNAEVTYGRFNRLTGKAYLSTPVVRDKLALSLAALSSSRDGIVTDRSTGRRYNDDDNTSFHAILRAEPSDALSLTLNADYTRQRTALTLGRAEADLRTVEGALLKPAPGAGNRYDYSGRTSFKGHEGQKLDHWGLSFAVDGKLDDHLTLSSLTAYRSLKPNIYMDIDASKFQLIDSFNDLRQHQLSQEFQLKYDSRRVDAIVGIYYLSESNKAHNEAYANDYATYFKIPATSVAYSDDHLETRSYAGFGQLSLHATDALSITAGLRYSYDEKYFTRDVHAIFGPPLTVLSRSYSLAQGNSWHAWTPSLTLDYQWSPELMTYASAARGYKSGGMNGRANSDAELRPYAPEYVWTYEGGVKSRWLDSRLRMNGAIFYSDYKNFQARVAEVLNANLILPVFSFPVINAARMENYGAELELSATPAERFNVTANIGYLNASYKNFIDASRDRSNDHPAFAPKWTVNLAADYTIELGAAGHVMLRTDANYKSKHWLSVDNRDVLTQDGYWLFNAGMRYNPAHGGWYLAAAVRNIGGRIYKTDAHEFSSVANVQTAYYGDPRSWTISAGVNF
nr:TonB-dependent receptor [Govania unica]